MEANIHACMHAWQDDRVRPLLYTCRAVPPNFLPGRGSLYAGRQGEDSLAHSCTCITACTRGINVQHAICREENGRRSLLSFKSVHAPWNALPCPYQCRLCPRFCPRTVGTKRKEGWRQSLVCTDKSSASAFICRLQFIVAGHLLSNHSEILILIDSSTN